MMHRIKATPQITPGAQGAAFEAAGRGAATGAVLTAH